MFSKLRTVYLAPVALAWVGLLFFYPTSKTTTCRIPYLAGTWENKSAKLHHPVRIELTYHCPEKKGPQGNQRTKAYWTIRAWSYCSPKNCKWGRLHVRKEPEGPIVTAFKTFSALRKIKLIREGTKLRVYYKIDYYYNDQADLTGNIFMTRVE